MVSISYNIGCRNCLRADEIRHMYQLIDDDADAIQSKTEFEVMTIIERWREEDNHTCNFCGSKNVEIFEIDVINKLIYDFEKIIERCEKDEEYMVQINIDKMGENINMSLGGSKRFQPNFFKQALLHIYETIKNRPDSHFKLQQNGNMFICLTGGTDFKDTQPYTRIEKFRSAGLLKGQILKAFQDFMRQRGISIDFTSTI